MPATPGPRSEATAVALLALVMLLWAGNHVVGRWAVGNIPPMTLAFLRWTGAAILILPFALRSLRAEHETIRAELSRLVVLGVLGSGLYNTLQYLALTETSVTSAAILNSSAPILIALAGVAAFGDRLRASQVVGLCVSLLGVLTIVLRADPATLATMAFNHGDLVMLGATALWAVYTTALRSRPKVSALSFAAVTYAVAAVFNLPLAAWEAWHGEWPRVTFEVAAAVAYTAALASCLAYYLYTASVEALGATRTGAFIHLIPLFASALAMLLLGEAPHLYHGAGFALILAGVWLASRRPAR